MTSSDSPRAVGALPGDAIAPILSRLDTASGLEALRGVRIGLEKESLRVDPTGHIARTPHPRALGSTLTHPYITTDFSEALVEFVTPPFERVEDSLRFLRDLHAFTYRHLGDELLWCTSMPCMVGDDASIPIAEYGDSNVGTMKRVYRQGLSHRYGRIMQTIAGVHFNMSMPESFWSVIGLEGGGRSRVDSGYFGCVRNILRYGWIVPLLFGSSPAICKSFLRGRAHDFQEMDDGTLFDPHATSLRMSDIGYTNANQAALRIDYDSLEGYVNSLGAAIATPHADYESIGVVKDGQYRQLNANILQIENEFYSPVRPKQITRSGEKPTVALHRRGVRYLELRSLDLDPFSCIGVSETSLRILEALVLMCAVLPSPPVADEREDISHAMTNVPRRGRDPTLRIRVGGQDATLREHARAVVEALEPICALLDRAHGDTCYATALRAQREAVEDFEQLPSARLLARLREDGVPFFRVAMNLSAEHSRTLRDWPLTPTQLERFEDEARQSLDQQHIVEEADRIDFAEYLRRYFDQTLDRREKLLG